MPEPAYLDDRASRRLGYGLADRRNLSPDGFAAASAIAGRLADSRLARGPPNPTHRHRLPRRRDHARRPHGGELHRQDPAGCWRLRDHDLDLRSGLPLRLVLASSSS